MKIAMIASESRPFCKTGGLADVVYSLSKELVNMGQDVSIIIPFYDTVKAKLKVEVKKVTSLDINLSWRHHIANVYTCLQDGVKYYFIEDQFYFERGHLYGDEDDGERFALFTLACKELLKNKELLPDIIHVHDWQPGMLACLLKNDVEDKKIFKNTKFVMTIHNPAFQGMLDPSALGNLYNLSDSLYSDGMVRLKDRVSTLKSGIAYSDYITTVSPTHHLELLTSEGGMGLDTTLRMREFDFSGILNGIDYLEFNPEDDKNIEKSFNVNNFIGGKKENKKALLKEFNLKKYNAPTFAMVSRLTWQKGIDLVISACYLLVEKGANVVILGSGEKEAEKRFEELRSRFPNQVGIYIGYSDPLAHKIYAGSDFFLMPSLFEPCGLGQMIAERYGTLPIVRRTGGLKDSVICYEGNNVDTANGFGFDTFAEQAMRDTVSYALETYQDSKIIKQLMKNAINTDNSWTKSATSYLKMYQKIYR